MSTTQRSARRTIVESRERGATARSRAMAAALAPLVILYLLYTLVRWTVADRGAAVGDANADRVLRLEKWLGIRWESSIQGFALDHDWLVRFANHYYVYAFLPVLLVSAVVSVIRTPRTFHFWRRIFAVSLGVALVGFALFPLTPPRLLPGQFGFVDTLLLHGPQYYGDESGASLFNAYGSIPSMVNVYAAMPSMHVGWSVIAGALVVAAFPGRWWLMLLAALHVAMMGLVVVITGNHYVIDVLAGLLVLTLSYLVIRWMQPRPYLTVPDSSVRRQSRRATVDQRW